MKNRVFFNGDDYGLKMLVYFIRYLKHVKKTGSGYKFMWESCIISTGHLTNDRVQIIADAKKEIPVVIKNHNRRADV